MRTVCPSCQAAYDVPESVLAARRTLRCARCATEFTALADGPAAVSVLAPPRAVEELSPAAPPAAKAFQPAAPEPVGRRPGDAVYLATPPASSRALAQMPPAIMAGWAASVIVLIAMGWAFVAWRASIMQTWPPSTHLYALLRLA